MTINRIEKIKPKKVIDKPIIGCLIKPGMSWLEKATTIDDCRFYLQGVYWCMEEKTFIASDGRRLHILKVDDKIPIELENLKSGIYLPLTHFENQTYSRFSIFYEIDAQFPDYKKIIPDEKNMVEAGKSDSRNPDSLLRLAYQIGMFNLQYLLDLQNKKGQSGWKILKENQEDPPKERYIKPCLFKCEDERRLAVIMPMSED
jgi:hypothetical protein